MPPPAGSIEVWRLDASDDLLETHAKLLSAEEWARAEAFTRDEPRRRFIVARARLRERLGAELGVPPAEVSFRYGPNGKPEVDGVEFNVAHTGDLALCAISDRPVGVDVERVRPMKNAAALAERWFHAEEVARIAAAVDPLAEFFRTWTMKEAALKLVGVGVGESLPRVLTPAERDGGWATGLPASALGFDRCWVKSVAIDNGHIAALATRANDGEPST